MTEQKTLNGVNVSQLFSTIDLIKQNPEVAKFKFRARNKWMQGTRNPHHEVFLPKRKKTTCSRSSGLSTRTWFMKNTEKWWKDTKESEES